MIIHNQASISSRHHPGMPIIQLDHNFGIQITLPNRNFSELSLKAGVIPAAQNLNLILIPSPLPFPITAISDMAMKIQSTPQGFLPPIPTLENTSAVTDKKSKLGIQMCGSIL
jgi:hypothetical protein